MIYGHKSLLSALKGNVSLIPPIWLMRQAGRYLPEYQETRKRAGDFLTLCYTPELAAEVTLQPIRRFGFDAAIIFSDILVIPQALGQKLEFREGEGPHLEAVETENTLSKLNFSQFSNMLSPVYEAIARTKTLLPKETTLIGFCGSPWTLASYMIEGKSSRDFSKLLFASKHNTAFFTSLITMLEEAIYQHAANQIKAGAEVIQLFDSWASAAEGSLYDQWVIAPTKRIVSRLKTEFTAIPIICFPRKSENKYLKFVEQIQPDSISVDQHIPEEILRSMQGKTTIQGFLDPEILFSSPEIIVKETRKILEKMANYPFIFNLGHGILPKTPIAHVELLIKTVRQG